MDNSFKKRYIDARNKIIRSKFSSLNPRQIEAVLTTRGPLLILAGAGSGKTTVLINRIANLLKFGTASDSNEIPENASEEDLAVLEAGDSELAESLCAMDRVEPWRIIAITFTNKAAEELKNRLEDMLGPEANDIWARTFHSACVRILRRFADRLGYPNNFTIYDSADRLSVMKGIIKTLDLDDKTYIPKVILNRLDAARNDMLSPSKFSEVYGSSGDPRERKLCEIYKLYSNQLFNAGAMDFDDLLYNTVRLFNEHPDVLRLYQMQFRYVLIDEYQDTNNLQYMLASMLAAGSGNICVVGDDDQSIYKFRGATIENILNFEGQFKPCRTIRLEQNYRSSGHILAAANAIIANNRERKGKTLWTEAPDGEKLVFYTSQNEDDEAQYVAKYILSNYSEGGRFSDNAILYRMNAQSNRIEFALKRNGIPYKVYGGTKFYDRAEVKDMLAYLSVILSPSDDLRLLRIINTPTRGIGKTTVELCSEISARVGKPLFDVISHADEYEELSRSAVNLIRFSDMISSLRELSSTLPINELYDAVLEKTGYIEALQKKPSIENTTRIENVSELKTNIQSYISESGDASLSGFLDEVALYTDLDSYDRENDCVVMMTMHSAKGLEYDNVFIVGMEEGIFPGLQSIGDDSAMEEERRLCYVAVTRARAKLYLCCARQRMIFGRTSMNLPSRFISEIPEEYLERGGYLPPKPKYDDFVTYARPTPYKERPAAALSVSASEAASFNAGDRIVHKIFGGGVIASIKPVGGDALIEIHFDGPGKKLLMLRTAAAYMKKE